MKLLQDTTPIIKKVKLDKADKEIVDIVLKDDLFVVENIDDNKKYDYEIDVNNFNLPVKVGDVVGKINVYYKNKTVKEADLTVSENIKKARFIDSDINSLSYFDLFKNELLDLIIGKF